MLMNELLLQLFELPRHKPLVLGLLALFVRQPLFLNQRSKHRKITETLLLEKVRVLKKSSLIVFFKHGSNPSDSLLELNVVKNNKNTVLGHLVFNFLPRADPRLAWGMACLLRALFLYREDNIFDNIHKNLDSLLDLLTDDLRAYLDGVDPEMPCPLRRVHVFGLLLHDLLGDTGFKEFLWEHFMLEKVAEILLHMLEYLSVCEASRREQVLDVACQLATALAAGLDPFKGFDFPNSKVPKKFNGDHLLLRKTGLALTCCRVAALAVSTLKKLKIRDTARALPWLSILDRLSGTQTGRCFVVFGINAQALSKEKHLAIKRNSNPNFKEALEKLRGDGFAKIEYKFGSSLRFLLSSLDKKAEAGTLAPTLPEAGFLLSLGRLSLNLLFGDDNDLKGLSALRVYFLENVFFKKKTIWEISREVPSRIAGLLGSDCVRRPRTRVASLIRRRLGLAQTIFGQLGRFLENYYPFKAKDIGLGKLFRKKSRWKSQKKARDYGRREDEKFKLRLQKYNQIHQRISVGKFNYEDDNIVPYLSDLEFFQSGSHANARASQVLGTF